MPLPRLLLALLVLALAACAGPRSRAGGEQGAEQVDRLGLAALLLKDGHLERAEAVLAEVNPEEEGLDRSRLHVLRGLLLLQRQDPQGARRELEAAVALGPVDPMVFVTLAQACAAGEDPQAALEQLARAGDVWQDRPAVHRLKVLCCWRLGRHAAAFGALAEAERRFPQDLELTRQRLLYLLELGLTLEAGEVGADYLRRAEGSEEAFLAVGEALRRARVPDQAAVTLEAGCLRHPQAEKLALALAHAHLDAGRPRAAAAALEGAARQNPAYLSEAAELYRRAGLIERAGYLNALVPDQEAKTRQRLSLLLERGRFVEAAALAPRLSRLGLLEADQDVRYALAYACYQAGDYDQSVSVLQGLTRPDLFRAATELRKAIEVERRLVEEGQ